MGACSRRCSDCGRRISRNPGSTQSLEREALKEYRKVHWGIEAQAIRNGTAPDPRVPLAALGHLLTAVYVTEKGGDGGLVEYEHDFGPRNLPILAFNPSGLVIVGGGYKVNERGIVG